MNAIDYGKVLTIPCQPNDTVSSVKTKIEAAMGGPNAISEEEIDSLNYLGVTLSCVNTLASYGIKDSAYLNMGRAYIKRVPQQYQQQQYQQQQYQQQYQPQYQQYPQQYGGGYGGYGGYGGGYGQYY